MLDDVVFFPELDALTRTGPVPELADGLDRSKDVVVVPGLADPRPKISPRIFASVNTYNTTRKSPIHKILAWSFVMRSLAS